MTHAFPDEGGSRAERHVPACTHTCRELEAMLHAMCGDAEECMLQVWHSCKEQPKCVVGVYQKHLADTRLHKQGTPPAASQPLAENAAAHVRGHASVNTATFCAGCTTVKPQAILATHQGSPSNGNGRRERYSSRVW